MSWPLWGARSVLAVVIGYPLMGLRITLVQENWPGGVSYTHSSLWVLFLGGTFTFLSAVAAGWVAGWIAGHHPLLHALVMSAIVVGETAWLIATGRTVDPVWFDVCAGASLIVGLLVGASLEVWRRAHLAGSAQVTAGA